MYQSKRTSLPLTITLTSHKGHGVWKHQKTDCLWNSFFRLTPTKASKLPTTRPLWGKLTVTGFPSLRDSVAETWLYDQVRQDCSSSSRSYATSTAYWCIASKLKVSQFFMEWIKRFCGWICHFLISLITTEKRTGYWRYYHSRCRPPRCQRAAMEPGVHTMSDVLILQISYNIFLALTMTSGQNISHYTTAKLSVHVRNHDLIWWKNKIDTQKHFHKTTITSLRTLSKTKIPITIVKAQMPSNLNQKSRTRDNYINTEITRKVTPLPMLHFVCCWILTWSVHFRHRTFPQSCF